MLLKRIVSALAILPIAIWLLWQGGWYFGGLAVLVTMLVSFEFFRIVFQDGDAAFWRGVGMAATALASAAFYLMRDGEPAQMLVLFLLFAGVSLTVLMRPQPIARAPEKLGLLFYGAFYTSFMLSRLHQMRQLEFNGENIGFGLVMFAFAASWGTDTGAYFTGKAIGKHKLYPEVSPNKTWEGAFGGLAFATLCSLGFWYFFMPSLPVIHLLVMAVLASAIGQAGDLIESLFKRACSVKDSGGIMPGHGGMLDRIDALLYCGPLIFYYVTYAAGASYGAG
ncbi:MAG: Phosphatidate cytidylyltransferase [Myxococcota bacterium]|nr:Phosphatidate cytidylyltransferase [Myxococcota bacterium]